MRLMISLLLLTIVMAPMGLAEQTATPLETLAFLSGRWTSSSPEDMQEEYWSPVMGDSIVGHFRVVVKGKRGEEKSVLYEFWVIELEDGKPVFKMKHFNHGLLGWEEKGDVVRLETRVESSQVAVFARPDGSLTLRYERRGDELISTLRNFRNGSPHEEVFHLHRSQ